MDCLGADNNWTLENRIIGQISKLNIFLPDNEFLTVWS